MKKRTPLLVLPCLAALGCDLAPKPKPAPLLTVTPEAVTLIQETQEICAKVAKTGIERMHATEEELRRARDEAVEAANNGGNPVDEQLSQASMPSDVLEKYLKEDAAPELAAVDRATEILRDLLPKVKDEAPQDLTQAVQSLFASEEQVCMRARSPRPKRADYQASLDFALHDYNNAEARLQGLYTVSTVDAELAAHKYNPLLNEARAGADSHAGVSSLHTPPPEELRRQRKEWESTQAYQQEQQAQHDAAVARWRREDRKEPVTEKISVAPNVAARMSLSPEKRAQGVRSWYNGYLAKAGPVRTALVSYMSLRRSSPDKLDPVCRDLMSATTTVISDPAMFDLPDVAASRILRKAYGDLQECARACVAGQDAEAAFRLSAYEGEISQAAAALQPYGVTP